MYEEFAKEPENAPVWKFTLLKSILKSVIMFFNIEPRCSAVWLSSSLSVEKTREIKLKAVYYLVFINQFIFLTSFRIKNL